MQSVVHKIMLYKEVHKIKRRSSGYFIRETAREEEKELPNVRKTEKRRFEVNE